MEVLKQTPLATVREYQKAIEERDNKIIELSKAKGLLEEQILQLMEVSAQLYEEKESLKGLNLSLAEAVAEVYEMVLVQGGTV